MIFLIFVVSGQGKRAALIGTICFFIGYLGNAKYPPNKNCVSCSSHRVVLKLAYLNVKITLLDQKRKVIVKVARYWNNLRFRKKTTTVFCFSWKVVKIVLHKNSTTTTICCLDQTWIRSLMTSYSQTKALCSRQQMTYSEMWAAVSPTLETSQVRLAFILVWLSVNAVPSTRPRNFHQCKCPPYQLSIHKVVLCKWVGAEIACSTWNIWLANHLIEGDIVLEQSWFWISMSSSWYTQWYLQHGTEMWPWVNSNTDLWTDLPVVCVTSSTESSNCWPEIVNYNVMQKGRSGSQGELFKEMGVDWGNAVIFGRKKCGWIGKIMWIGPSEKLWSGLARRSL